MFYGLIWRHLPCISRCIDGETAVHDETFITLIIIKSKMTKRIFNLNQWCPTIKFDLFAYQKLELENLQYIGKARTKFYL